MSCDQSNNPGGYGNPAFFCNEVGQWLRDTRYSLNGSTWARQYYRSPETNYQRQRREQREAVMSGKPYPRRGGRRTRRSKGSRRRTHRRRR